MAGVHIVIDSGAAIPGGAAQDYSLSIVPQNVIVGDEQFHGGTDESGDGLLEILRRHAQRPRVTASPEVDYLEVYSGVLSWGVDVISLHPPAGISNSVEAARRSVAQLAEASRISIVETPLLGPALGLAALRAAQAGIDDRSRAEIEALLATLMPRIALRTVSTDLTYAEKFGELDAETRQALALAGPEAALVHRLEGGELRLESVEPTLGLALRRLADAVVEAVPEGHAWHLSAFSADADAEAAALATFLDSRRPAREAWIAACDPILASLLGPGSFGVAWYLEA